MEIDPRVLEGFGGKPNIITKGKKKGLDGLDWDKLPSGFKKVVGGTQIAAAMRVATMDAETRDRLYDRPMDVLAGAVRTVVQAPDGVPEVGSTGSAAPKPVRFLPPLPVPLP